MVLNALVNRFNNKIKQVVGISKLVYQPMNDNLNRSYATGMSDTQRLESKSWLNSIMHITM